MMSYSNQREHELPTATVYEISCFSLPLPKWRQLQPKSPVPSTWHS